MSDLAELPEDIRNAIERCKEFQIKRDEGKPNCPAPGAFLIVACDETMVMMPPTIVDSDRLTRMITNQDKRDLLRYLETYVNCTIFWIRGQAGEGPTAAVEHIKKVRNSGWTKSNLYADAANALQEIIEQTKSDMAVTPPSAKKY